MPGRPVVGDVDGQPFAAQATGNGLGQGFLVLHHEHPHVLPPMRRENRLTRLGPIRLHVQRWGFPHAAIPVRPADVTGKPDHTSTRSPRVNGDTPLPIGKTLTVSAHRDYSHYQFVSKAS
jgi:hypothetical protein